MKRKRFSRHGSCCLLALLAIAVPRVADADVAGEPWAHAGNLSARDTAGRESGSLATFPLSFVENRGQWNDEILFTACRGGVVASFLADGIRLHVASGAAERSVRSLTLTFEGGYPREVVGETTAPTLFSFLRGHSPRPELSGIRSFRSLLYCDLYPGVDMRIREAEVQELSRQIEYDLHVNPGVSLETIVIRCDGVDTMWVESDGSVMLIAGAVAVRQPPPVCWQVQPSGERSSVECLVVMLDESRFMFEVPGRDPTLPLVIDPAIVFATYIGGAGEDFIFGMALEATGIVVGGFTSSMEPLPGGVVGDAEYAGGRYDGFVARLDYGLRELRSFTFLGGSGEERLLSVAVTSTGSIAVVGSTSSATDFPTTDGAAQTTYGGGLLDGFLTVLDPTGTQIEYSTFLGGPEQDLITSVVVDTLDRIVVAGISFSPSFTSWPEFPARAGGFQELNRGASDVIVLRLKVGPDVPHEQQVEYCTFVGGSRNEAIQDVDWETARLTDLGDKPYVALGEANTVLVTGFTQSTDFPTTPGSYQPTSAGGFDAFLCQLSLDTEIPPADQLLYSTYLGGNSGDGCRAVCLDPSGDAWVSGFTYSTNFPTTPDAYSRNLVANDDVFLTRLRLDRSLPPAEQLIYSTLIGGTGWDFANAHTVDPTGAITVVGCRMAGDFPVTEPGGSDGFIAHFRPVAGDGRPPYALRYASTVGTMYVPWTIAQISTDEYLVAAYSLTSGLPSFEGAVQEESGGGWESGLALLSLKIATACFTLESGPESTAPFDVRVDAACSETPEGTEITAYQWDFGDGATGEACTESHTYTMAGRYVIRLSITNSAGFNATATKNVTVTCPPGDVLPWKAADIGTPLFPGSSRKEGDDMIVCAGGQIPVATADQLHCIYQEISGDCSVIARIEEPMSWVVGARIGLMVRESLAPDAPYAAILPQKYTSDTRLVFRFRSNGVLSARSHGTTTLPLWLKLTRQGQEVIALTSVDGVAWTEVDRETISFAADGPVLVGLAACGADSGDPLLPFTPLQARVEGLALVSGDRFERGDANADGKVDIADAISVLGYLFGAAGDPSKAKVAQCLDAADANDDGKNDIADAIKILGHLFAGDGPLPGPFGECGVDPSQDELDCAEFAPCGAP